jgi:hypothetical protein
MDTVRIPAGSVAKPMHLQIETGVFSRHLLSSDPLFRTGFNEVRITWALRREPVWSDRRRSGISCRRRLGPEPTAGCGRSSPTFDLSSSCASPAAPSPPLLGALSCRSSMAESDNPSSSDLPANCRKVGRPCKHVYNAERWQGPAEDGMNRIRGNTSAEIQPHRGNTSPVFTPSEVDVPGTGETFV